MNDVIDVVGISGGKDSTATALYAIENLETPPRFVFCDTGIEAPVTYEYIDYLSDKLKSLTGEAVEVVKADFTERIEKKRNNLLAKGETERAKALVATGNPFLDLCVWKGRFPSSQARFCTGELKIEPLICYLKSFMSDGVTVMSWTGERAEESATRAKKPVKEAIVKGENSTVYTYRPILRWTEQMCFEKLKEHGIKPNPLYAQGFSRVGCFPCFMYRKSEIALVASKYPEVFERLKEWEVLVSKACKREIGSNFFVKREGKESIDQVIEWSKTSRGGKQYPLIFEE